MSDELENEEVVDDQDTSEVDENEEDNTETAAPKNLEEALTRLETLDAATFAVVKKAIDKANSERARLGKKVKETKAQEPVEVPVLSDSAKRALAVAELRTRGLTDSQAKRMSKLISTDDIEIDDEGNVTGFDFDDVEEDFPELFRKDTTPAKRPHRKIDTGDKKDKANPPSVLSDASRKMLGLDK